MNPFQGPPPEEVHLDRAPLDCVICQLRFPAILSIGKDEFVAPFQEAIRKDYPLAEPIQPFPLQMPGGETPLFIQTAKSYRFSAADRSFRLTLAADFLTLETSKYTTRTDFLGHLEQALAALAAHVAPSHWSRLGIRYVDRIRGEEMAQLRTFFRPELLGLMGSEASCDGLKQALSEAVLTVAEGNLAIRWGLLPAGRTLDPFSIPTEPEASWILDLDAFQECTERLEPFAALDVVTRARALAERSYAFFRWATLPPFLRTYGG